MFTFLLNILFMMLQLFIISMNLLIYKHNANITNQCIRLYIMSILSNGNELPEIKPKMYELFDMCKKIVDEW